MAEFFYYSLDEARAEIKRRFKDKKLIRKIELELGDKLIPQFNGKLRGACFKQICPADNGFNFFYQCSKYIGAEPLIIEYHDDIFVHFNEEKKGLGRLRIVLKDGKLAMVDIMDFHRAEKKPLGKIRIKTGKKLVDFHHNLFKILGSKFEFCENSKWFKNIGQASEYYYYFLLHFLAHGVLFETFSLEKREKDEENFVKNIIVPSIKKIEKKFNKKPIIVRSYPENQTDREDFYWWCYPSQINKYIVEYAKKNKIPFKEINLI